MKETPDTAKFRRKSRPRSGSVDGGLPEADLVGELKSPKRPSDSGPEEDLRHRQGRLIERKKPLERVREMSAEETLLRKQRKEARIRELEQELEASEQLLRDYRKSHTRLRTENEVVKTRDETTMPHRVAEAKAIFMRDMLETYDNLERCIEASRKESSVKALYDGVSLVQRQFMLHLKELGLAAYNPLGEGYVAETMSQVGVVPVANVERDGKVVLTVNPGYRLGSIVIRQAQVQVGRKFR